MALPLIELPIGELDLAFLCYPSPSGALASCSCASGHVLCGTCSVCCPVTAFALVAVASGVASVASRAIRRQQYVKTRHITLKRTPCFESSPLLDVLPDRRYQDLIVPVSVLAFKTAVLCELASQQVWPADLCVEERLEDVVMRQLSHRTKDVRPIVPEHAELVAVELHLHKIVEAQDAAFAPHDLAVLLHLEYNLSSLDKPPHGTPSASPCCWWSPAALPRVCWTLRPPASRAIKETTRAVEHGRIHFLVAGLGDPTKSFVGRWPRRREASISNVDTQMDLARMEHGRCPRDPQGSPHPSPRV